MLKNGKFGFWLYNNNFSEIEAFLMGLLSKAKKMVKYADFFYSTQMLRFENDLQYKTLTGGIISLGIIITIIVGFASMILNTLDLNMFNTSTQIIKNTVPPPAMNQIHQNSRFRFAIQIWKQNLSDTKRYFDITFTEVQESYGVPYNRTDIKLEACTKEYFKDYPDVVKNFDKLMAGYWLCPAMNTNINVSGKYSSEYYNQYIVMVSACNNATDPLRPCATPQEIKNYFAENQQFFYFDFYFTNPQINPDKKDYKQYYLQDMTYAIFGSDLGCQTFLYFTDYTVSTDYSIWPFTSIQEDKGLLVENNAMNHNFRTNIDNYYIYFSLAKSSNSIVYSREVQKLSTVFSFMGGMIGAVSAVLFIIKIYTSISFQFSIAFEIFKKRQVNTNNYKNTNQENGQSQLKKSQTKAQLESQQEFTMNFFNFLRYYIHFFFQKLGCKYNWPQIKYAQECKNEILRQLDVRLLLKRIIFIEHCLTYLIDDFQLDALQLKKPVTPQEIKELREKCQSIVDHQQSLASRHCKSFLQVQIISCNQPKTPQMSSRIFLNLNQSSPQLKNEKLIDVLPTCPKLSDLKQKKQSIFNQEDIIVDISSKQQEQSQASKNIEIVFKQPSDIRKANQEDKSGLKIANLHKKQENRRSYLQQLKKDVQEGNPISNKIWKKLDINIRNSITKPPLP